MPQELLEIPEHRDSQVCLEWMETEVELEQRVSLDPVA